MPQYKNKIECKRYCIPAMGYNLAGLVEHGYLKKHKDGLLLNIGNVINFSAGYKICLVNPKGRIVQTLCKFEYEE